MTATAVAEVRVLSGFIAMRSSRPSSLHVALAFDSTFFYSASFSFSCEEHPDMGSVRSRGLMSV